MQRIGRCGLAVVLALGGAVFGMAQGMGRGMGQGMGGGMMEGPQLPMRFFQPTLGKGAEYEMTSPSEKGPTPFTYAVVGKETVAGGEGYWLEMRMEPPGESGEFVMKSLMVGDSEKVRVERVIMQMPGMPPMEMQMNMLPERATSGQDPGQLEKVGTESVTVPAGTYTCDHYRWTREGNSSDAWISTKVGAYGLVKMVDGGMTVVLKKELAGETSHIQGEPQKMPGFPGGMPPMPRKR